MPRFSHLKFDFDYLDEGNGPPIVLIHGFASSMSVNWVSTGWVKTLTEAGYRVLAFDNRGHGGSTKSYDDEDYFPGAMAGDAVALLDHADIDTAHVMGYSMGSRITAHMALDHSERVRSAVLGGLGTGLLTRRGDWNKIADALVTDNPESISDERGKMFRKFADQTKSDRKALAACIATNDREMSEAEVRRISSPVLVAVGTTDDIAGEPEPLARLLPNGTSFDIVGRDHMLSVGDKTFKKRVIEFLAENSA